MLASGPAVEIVGNDLLAIAIGLLWLVGITNAFNLLDNMDGLAASLATVSCAVFAVDAIARDTGELGLVVALALGGACLGFLPFNLRPGRRARVFMGDSGSQVIGFGLASLALASSWTTAGATLTSILAAAPRARRPDPRHDASSRSGGRSSGGPVTQGGTDHSSHRLVYYGLSEQQAVAALTLLAALLGATALAYNVLADARVTAVGRARVVRRSSCSSRASSATSSSARGSPRQARRRRSGAPSSRSRAASSRCSSTSRSSAPRSSPRTCSSSTAAAPSVAARDLPRAAADAARRCATCSFVALRDLPARLAFRAAARPARDRGRRRRCRCRSRSRSSRRLRPFADFPLEIFLVDALLCMRARGRLAPGAAAGCPTCARPHAAARSARVLIVGAGRSGRQPRPGARTRRRRHASSASSTTTRASRRRRDPRRHGATAASTSSRAQLGVARPGEVLVTIPDIAPQERLDAVPSRHAQAAGVSCRFVRAASRSRRRRWSRSRPSELRDDAPGRALDATAGRFILAFAYLCAAALYTWQAGDRVSPTIFSDEIEFTQISRSIATNRAARAAGEPRGFEIALHLPRRARVVARQLVRGLRRRSSCSACS